jgi:hypothetical protein
MSNSRTHILLRQHLSLNLVSDRLPGEAAAPRRTPTINAKPACCRRRERILTL